MIHLKTIKIKMFYFSLGIILLITCSVIFTLNYYLKLQINNNIEKNLITATGIFEKFQKDRLEILLSNVEIIAKNSDLVRSLSVLDNLEIKEELGEELFLKTTHLTILETIKKINKVMDIGIFIITDQYGTVLANLKQEGSYGADFSQFSFMKDIISEKIVVNYFSFEEKLYEIVGHPIFFGKENRMAGSVVLGFPIDTNTAIKIKNLYGFDINFFIEGEIVSSSLNKNKKDILTDIIKSDINKFQTGKFLLLNLDNEEFLTTPVPLKNVILGDAGFAVIQKSKTEGNSFIKKIQNIMIIISIVSIILSSTIGYFISDGIVNPIKILVENTKIIASGDLSKEIIIHSTDEIGLLAGFFDKMRISLKNTIINLQEAKNTLEDRVKERTNDLTIINKRLEELSQKDYLTGLYNHKYFQEQLKNEIARASRYNQHLTLLFCDLDKFKNFNDTQGHPMGDKLLKEIADIFNGTLHAGTLRKSDTIARYGGDEFVLILPQTDKAGGIIVADRILKKVEKDLPSNQYLPEDQKITISIGVVEYPEDVNNIKDLITNADNTMYKAKKQKGNKVIPFTKEIC